MDIFSKPWNRTSKSKPEPFPDLMCTTEDVFAAIGTKSLLEVRAFWEVQQKQIVSMALIIGIYQRLYQLAYWEPGVPVEHRKIALTWADSLTETIENYYEKRDGLASVEALRKAVATIKEGDLDRPY
jgi:hypothetical protein